MKFILFVLSLLCFSYDFIAVAQREKPDLFSLEAKSELINQLNKYSKNGQFDLVIKGLVPVVNAYLQGKELKAYQFHVVTNHNMLFPAAISRVSNGDFLIFLNAKRFERSIQVGIYKQEEIEQAKIICLFHELVHGWQIKNIPRQQRSTFKMEGHAVFIQGIFAKDFGIEQINLKGIKAFAEPRKISFVTEQSIFKSWLIKKYVDYFYLSSRRVMAKAFESANLKSPHRLNYASLKFFSRVK